MSADERRSPRTPRLDPLHVAVRLRRLADAIMRANASRPWHIEYVPRDDAAKAEWVRWNATSYSTLQRVRDRVAAIRSDRYFERRAAAWSAKNRVTGQRVVLTTVTVPSNRMPRTLELCDGCGNVISPHVKPWLLDAPPSKVNILVVHPNERCERQARQNYPSLVRGQVEEEG